jgi:hypothetical protein
MRKPGLIGHDEIAISLRNQIDNSLDGDFLTYVTHSLADIVAAFDVATEPVSKIACTDARTPDGPTHD